MSYQSFTYDLPNDVDTSPLGKCIVAFRPLSTWDGSNYGFDWIRVCDTGLKGDVLYADNMGEYLDSSGKRVDMIPKFDVAYIDNLIKNPIQYDKLTRDYFADKHLILWKRPKTPFTCADAPNALVNNKGRRKSGSALQRERKNHLKRIKEEAEYTYFTPVMTLMGKNKAELQLLIDFMPDRPKPKKIEIVADTPENFEIKANIDPNNADTFKCEITALKTFDDDQRIYAKAIYTDTDGNDTAPEICGWLTVLKNRLRGTVNINCFNVKLLNAHGDAFNQNFINPQPSVMDLTAKFLHQAMISANVIYHSDLVIDINRPIKHPDNWNDMFNFSIFLTSSQDHYDKPPLAYCLYEAKSNYIKPFYENTHNFITATFGSVAARIHSPSITADIKTKYDNFLQSVSIKEARKIEAVKEMMTKLDKEICVFFLDLPYSGTTLAYSSGQYNVVYYSSVPTTTTAHEICHSLDLAHSFASEDSNNEKSKNAKSKNAKYTYKALITDNLMDYSESNNPVTKISTWHWQWKIMWNKIYELKGNVPVTAATPPEQDLTAQRKTFLQEKADKMDAELKLLLEDQAKKTADLNNKHAQEFAKLDDQEKVTKRERTNMEKRHRQEKNALVETQKKSIIEMFNNYETSITK